MNLADVQAVLLDMDGTLVDSDAAVERAWRTWAGEYRTDPGRVLAIAHGSPAERTVRRVRPDLSGALVTAATRSGPIAISAEAMQWAGQKYSPLASRFRQFAAAATLRSDWQRQTR